MIGSISSLSPLTCSWCVVRAIHLIVLLWLSLLSTCSWCVVSASTWLSLWLSLPPPPLAGVLVSAYTWIWLYDSSPLHLRWCVVSAYHLSGSMTSPLSPRLSSSPPVAGGVSRIHLICLLWPLVPLSSPPVAGVCERIHLIVLMSLSPLHSSPPVLCVVRTTLDGSMTLSPLHL